MGPLSPQTPMSDLAGGATPLAALSERLRATAGSGAGRDKLQEVAEKFESVFVHRLLEEMRRTIPDDGFLSGGISRQMKGLFWYFLAQDVAKKGGFGIGRRLVEQYRQAAAPADTQPRTESKI